MTHETSVADRLYPSTASPASTPSASGPGSLADRLFPSTASPSTAPTTEPTSLLGDPAAVGATPEARPSSVPAAVAADRKADPARRLFGSTEFVFDMPDGSVPGLDAAEARQVAQDLGATGDDVRAFASLAKQHLDPSEEQAAAWRAEALAMLKRNELTEADLDLARRFVARDKRLYAALDRGLGNEPRVVKRVIEMARSARAAGKKF